MLSLLFALSTITSPECHDNTIYKIEEMGKIIEMTDGATYRIRNNYSGMVYSNWIKFDPVSICGETTIKNIGAGETIHHALRLR